MTERRMKDSGIPWIGMIPEEWEVCRFKDTHNGTNVGESIDKQYWIEDISFIPFYSASITPMHTNYKDFPKWKYTKCEDLLLSRNGTPYVYLPIVNAAYTDHIIRVSIKNYFNKKFVKYCIEQSIQSVVVNTVSLATWSASIWNEQKIPLPSLAEQEAIAGWLDGKCGEIDKLIEVEQKMIAELEAYRQATITETVTHGLNPDAPMRQTNISWIPEIPEHWSKDKILRLFGLFGSGTTPKGEEWFTDEYGIPWINSGELNFGFLENTKKSVKKQAIKEIPALKVYPKYSIIIAMYGASIGKIAITKLEGCTNQACFVMSNERDDVELKYIFYQLLSFKDKWIELSFGGTQPNINADNIKQKWVALPPLDEQQAIADYLDAKCREIDDLIAVKREKIETLKQYRQSIIFEAITGKIQIN